MKKLLVGLTCLSLSGCITFANFCPMPLPEHGKGRIVIGSRPQPASVGEGQTTVDCDVENF